MITYLVDVGAFTDMGNNICAFSSVIETENRVIFSKKFLLSNPIIGNAAVYNSIICALMFLKARKLNGKIYIRTDSLLTIKQLLKELEGIGAEAYIKQIKKLCSKFNLVALQHVGYEVVEPANILSRDIYNKYMSTRRYFETTSKARFGL